jgi:hypothetical protein
MPPEKIYPEFKDIGGGLLASIVDGAIAHWNVDVPGVWERTYTLTQVGSYVSKFCRPGPGIYRLIGLDEANKPAVLDWLCGQDHAGTLYIGREGKNFAVQSRLTKLVRSLREPRDYRDGVGIFNVEHNAGYLRRSHPILSRRFPTSRLAITWCYMQTNSFSRAIAAECLL